jgi:hypothetical protein
MSGFDISCTDAIPSEALQIRLIGRRSLYPVQEDRMHVAEEELSPRAEQMTAFHENAGEPSDIAGIFVAC